MELKMKIFQERPTGGFGCCTCMSYTEEERKSQPGTMDRIAVSALTKKLRETYGDKLSVDFYDPRCFAWIGDVFRYRLRGGEVTWVLDNSVVFRGVPSWEQLKELVDTAVKAAV